MEFYIDTSINKYLMILHKNKKNKIINWKKKVKNVGVCLGHVRCDACEWGRVGEWGQLVLELLNCVTCLAYPSVVS